MKFVTCYGVVYRVPDRKYKEMMEDIRDTGGADVARYGTCLGKMVNVTDMTQEEAAGILEDLKDE